MRYFIQPVSHRHVFPTRFHLSDSTASLPKTLAGQGPSSQPLQIGYAGLILDHEVSLRGLGDLPPETFDVFLAL